MIAKLYSATVLGIKAMPIEVEVDTSSGLHSFNIVGLPDKSIQESKDRVSAAIKNSGALAPNKQNRRITVNLAPANLKKEGPSYDLPIAVGFLLSTGQVAKFETKNKIFIGELSLDGKIKRINGALPIALMAKENNLEYLILPEENAKEAAFVKEIKIIPVNDLKELINFLENKITIAPYKKNIYETISHAGEYSNDISEIRGQSLAKRALEIAAAGGHNILLSGPPGSGKTMLARALPSILPPLCEKEILEISQIWSVKGLTNSEQPLILERPFRSPHHTASAISIIGGGSWPQPGEISLSHRGVLFLDEFPEFPRNVLEGLRQPLEDGFVAISRVQGHLVFPSRFILVAAMNPCPCGYFGDPEKECKCSPREILKYQKKISGPLLDRIDLQVEAPRLNYSELKSPKNEDELKAIRERITAARNIQAQRFKNLQIITNSEMNTREIEKFCAVEKSAELLLKNALEKDYISGRGYFRILKISRTIADLEQSDIIKHNHIAEALSYKIRVEK